MNKLHCYEYNNEIPKSQQMEQYATSNRTMNITEGMECFKWITDPIRCAHSRTDMMNCRVPCDSTQTGTAQTGTAQTVTAQTQQAAIPPDFPIEEIRSNPNIPSSPYLSDNDNKNVKKYIQYADYWTTYNSAVNATDKKQAYKDIYNSYSQMTTLQNKNAIVCVNVQKRWVPGRGYVDVDCGYNY